MKTTEGSRRTLRSWTVGVGVVAAVAAAIALPTVLLLGSGAGPGSGARGDRTIEAVALGDLAVGAEPKQGYLAGMEFRNGENLVRFELAPPTSVTEIAVISGGYLLSTSDALANERVRFISDSGTTGPSWEVSRLPFFPTLVVSPDRSLGAFVQADGTSVVVEASGSTFTELPSPGRPIDSDFAPVAVSGHGCCSPDADCSVLVHGPGRIDDDGKPLRTWTVRPGQPAVAAAKGIGEVRAVAANGFSAGTTAIVDDGDGACGGVADTAGSILWKTCKDRLISFSPNSELVLGSTSALFGSGDHELSVFDAPTGVERLRLKSAENVGIYEMVWEDDEHVLAVVSEWKIDEETGDHVDIRWAVLRVDLEGTREYAVTPVPGEENDYDGPLDLPRG